MDVAELRGVAETVATEAAALVRERRAAGVEVAATKSSAVDIVTETDRESEAFLRARLGRVRPGDGFLGEEGGAAPSSSGVVWVVDPIDGTVNFLYGLPQYAVSVAAMVEDRSVAGAVVNVATGELFSAARGRGATLDGRPLRVRPPAPLEERLVLTGFQYRAEVRALQGRAVAAMLPQVRDIRRNGAASLDLCSVAAGRADAYVEEGLQLWDHAAGGLVAGEAGARLSFYPGVGGSDATLCAPDEGFEEFLDLVTRCGFLAPKE